MIQDLKIENKFEKISIRDLSQETLFKYFFFSNQNIAFIIDEQESLYGIITLGDFLKNKGILQNSINKKYLFVNWGLFEDMLLEAQKIYDKYKIGSNIPIINDTGKIVGYIYDNKVLYERKKTHENLINNFKNKISKYKQSYYLQKEITAFYQIIKNTIVYIKGGKTLEKLIDLFGRDICKKFIILNDDEYYSKVKDRMKNKNITDEEKTSLIFDFDLSYRKFLCNTIYDLERFTWEFSDIIDKGGFSRLLRVTKNLYYSLNDYVIDHDFKEIAYPSYLLVTKFIYDYLKLNHHKISLIDSEYHYGIRAKWLVNGIRESKDRIDELFICDMIGQQVILNKKLSSSGVKIFNIQGATKAKLTEGERKRFKLYPNDFESMFDENNYESIEKLYGEDYKENAINFVKELISYRYPIIRRFEQDLFINLDYNSPYINFENGIRKTFYQPEHYKHSIYLIGPCFALGMFVEDKDTIASFLSKLIVRDGYFYRVINLGMLISNDIQDLIDNLDIQEDDIIINFLSIEGNHLQSYIDIIQSNEAFDKIPNRSDMFLDTPLHCNRKGNEIYANLIYDKIKKALKKNDKDSFKKNIIYNIFKTNNKDFSLYGVDQYLNMLNEKKRQIPNSAKEIGSIVMNCNPFTLGHRYLIEYASKHSDYFFIFVVEEERSFFQFKDRIKMIKSGCSDIKNVSIIPSGKMIVSDLTLPEYFKREIVRDENTTKKNIKLNTSTDLVLFARYIVPALGITKRFVAEEPLDDMIKQYNEGMKKILTSFDIELIEIPRKRLNNGEVISASSVRRLYKNRKFEKMKELLPNTTYDYLMKNQNKYIIKY